MKTFFLQPTQVDKQWEFRAADGDYRRYAERQRCGTCMRGEQLSVDFAQFRLVIDRLTQDTHLLCPTHYHEKIAELKLQVAVEIKKQVAGVGFDLHEILQLMAAEINFVLTPREE